MTLLWSSQECVPSTISSLEFTAFPSPLAFFYSSSEQLLMSCQSLHTHKNTYLDRSDAQLSLLHAVKTPDVQSGTHQLLPTHVLPPAFLVNYISIYPSPKPKIWCLLSFLSPPFTPLPHPHRHWVWIMQQKERIAAGGSLANVRSLNVDKSCNSRYGWVWLRAHTVNWHSCLRDVWGAHACMLVYSYASHYSWVQFAVFTQGFLRTKLVPEQQEVHVML